MSPAKKIVVKKSAVKVARKPRMTDRQLVERMVEQGDEHFSQNARMLLLLNAIKESLTNMANQVVTEVNAKLDTIEQTLRDESAEIQAAIEAASAGGATPEELAALNARLDGLNTAIEALVTTPEPTT